MVLSVVWKEQTIPIQIIYSDRRRSWAIEVKTTGEVFIRVPCGVPEEEVREIAQKKAEWIAKKQSLFHKREQGPRRYAEGDLIPFFGDMLIIERSTAPSRAEVSGKCLKISIPESFSPDDAELIARDLVMFLYRRLGVTVLDSFMKKYADLAGVEKPPLRMRLQKKKWGCCTPKNGIIINARVLLAPKIVAEYLVIHEIVHLRFRHHKKSYWEEVERLMPEYRNVEKLMKTDGWKWEF